MAPKLLTALIAAGFVLCWSSGFVGGRLATESTTPIMLLFAWRLLFATLVVGVWWRLTHRDAIPWLPMRQEFWVGILTMGGYLLGVILALEFGVSTGVTALIASLQPLLAAGLAGPWLGERQSTRGWVGMAIATVGVLMCVLGDFNGAGNAPLWAYGLPLMSVVSLTVGSILGVRLTTVLPMAATLTAQLSAATLVFVVAALVVVVFGWRAGHDLTLVPSFDPVTVVAIAWLILLSSFGGYGFFVASLRRTGVTATTTLVYLTPPVTLVWAALMFGEEPTLLAVAGMLVASGGVALAMTKLPAVQAQVWPA